MDYAMVVRKVVEHVGFAAFAKSNDTESMVHYGAQNAKIRKIGVRHTMGKAVSRACYAWNGETGCHRMVECRFAHICSKCELKSHKRQKCKDRLVTDNVNTAK